MNNTDYSVHPSEYLEELIEESHLTLEKCYETLGMNNTLSFLAKETHITPEFAGKLAKLTTIPALTWIKLQVLYHDDEMRLSKDL